MPTLWIEEEYGYRDWVAELSEEELAELRRRWCTMRGLFCSVPVPLIVPQAREASEEDSMNYSREGWLSAHIHECNDSWLEGVDYEIPEAEPGVFHMDGRQYTLVDFSNMLYSRKGPGGCP